LAVNPLIDAAGRAVVVRAVVRNSDTSLRPGMFARVRLITRDSKEALVLPEQALVPQGDQQYVFKIVNDRAVRTKVDVGQRRDAKVEVVGGLSKDDVVVTAGQIKLRDNVPVKVAATRANDRAAAAAPKAGELPAAKPGGGSSAVIAPAQPAPAKAEASPSSPPRKS
jgi:membrane fusion protein (multidrug efflux system)